MDAKSAQAWLSSAQAGPLLGADGFVKARELLAKPLPEFHAGNVVAGDQLGSWQPNAVPQETWRIGDRSVSVYY